MKLALHGATGRMGRAIARLASEAPDLDIVGAVSHPDDENQGRDVGELAGVGPLGVFVGPDLASALLGADVLIDFSLAPAFPNVVAAARKAKVPLVTGTTGLSPEMMKLVDDAGADIPILWSRNMSLGIQLLAALVKDAVARLGPEFDVEIVEVHHRRKVDSPSGTAKRLMDAVALGRNDVRALYERHGQVGARTDEEVGVFGLRGGDVLGDHTVHLMGPGERLELTHRATSRDVFAHGALRAARWLAERGPGSYSIEDVVAE